MFNFNQGATKFNRQNKRPVPPTPPSPAIKDESQNIILRIQLNDSIIAFRKEDSPSIHVNEYGRIIEIETNKTNIILGLNNIKFITYNPDECMTYYSD